MIFKGFATMQVKIENFQESTTDLITTGGGAYLISVLISFAYRPDSVFCD